MIKVHRLSCATLRPPLGWLLCPGGTRMPCNCLLLELPDGLVLVDTGLGLGDIDDPVSRLTRAFCHVVKPDLDPEETALRQVQRLGFEAADLRRVVLTHLDLDHAGGLPDFPGAEVVLLAEELEALTDPVGLIERRRYRDAHLAHGPRWAPLPRQDGEPWLGLAGARELPGAGGDLLLVPLPGHTRGHAGVAVKQGERWLLHAGDTMMSRFELQDRGGAIWTRDHGLAGAGLPLYHHAMDQNPTTAEASRARLRALMQDHAGEVDLVLSHDPE